MLGGVDYYSSLAPYLISFDYTDSCDGKKADDLGFQLADREGKFIRDWMPEKGAYLDASIIASNWFMPYASGLSLDCGRFWLDSIEFSLPEQTVSVKGTSIPTNARLKGSKENRGWEKTTLQDIATQVAGESQMSVDWQADINPRYKRTEMHDESPLAFLMKRAKDAKLSIKIHRNKIVFFDEQKLEEAGAAFSLLYGNTAMAISGASYRMAGGHFTTKVTDTSKEAKVAAMDPETGELNSGEYKAPDEDLEEDTGDRVNADTDTDDGDGGNGGNGNGGLRTLEGTDWGGDGANSGATLKAKSHVRDKNKEKDKASVELSLGNPLVAAGQTFNLVGCGQFDGLWFIETAHHTLGPEYKTSLTIRKCLKGY
jgi:phage protein D